MVDKKTEVKGNDEAIESLASLEDGDVIKVRRVGRTTKTFKDTRTNVVKTIELLLLDTDKGMLFVNGGDIVNGEVDEKTGTVAYRQILNWSETNNFVIPIKAMDESWTINKIKTGTFTYVSIKELANTFDISHAFD